MTTCRLHSTQFGLLQGSHNICKSGKLAKVYTLLTQKIVFSFFSKSFYIEGGNSPKPTGPPCARARNIGHEFPHV